MAHSAPHNQDARRPANTGDFPPPIIVDMFNGRPALLQWGMQEGRDGIWSSAQLCIMICLNQERMDRRVGLDTEEARLPTPLVTPRFTRGKKRQGRDHQSRASAMNETMDLVALLWSQSGPKHISKCPTLVLEKPILTTSNLAQPAQPVA